MHNVTDGRTDRQTDNIISPIADDTACSAIGTWSCSVNRNKQLPAKPGEI